MKKKYWVIIGSLIVVSTLYLIRVDVPKSNNVVQHQQKNVNNTVEQSPEEHASHTHTSSPHVEVKGDEFVERLSNPMRQQINRLTSSSHEGLEMEAVKGGGYKVDLQGRFRHVAVAQLNEDGVIEVREFGSSIPLKDEGEE